MIQTRQTRRCVSLKRGLYERLKAKAIAEHKSMSAVTEKALEEHLAPPTRTYPTPAGVVTTIRMNPLSDLVTDLRKSWGM
jgi:hypothetical protein